MLNREDTLVNLITAKNQYILQLTQFQIELVFVSRKLILATGNEKLVFEQMQYKCNAGIRNTTELLKVCDELIEKENKK